MAEKLSPSETESLLAAVRADSILLPETSDPIDEHVDFESFEKNTNNDSFLAQLIQHTVEGLATVLGLEMSILSVEFCNGPQIRAIDPSITLKMTNVEPGFWTLNLDSDLALPMAATALCLPVEDCENRTEPELSFIERQLLLPLIHEVVHHLNEQRFLESPLTIYDTASSDDSGTDEFGSNTVPGRIAMCTICGINEQRFTGTLTFEVPEDVVSRQSYQRPEKLCEDTVELIVSLTETEINWSDVADMEVGDLLVTDVNPESRLSATLDGRPVLRGTMGIFQGRKALQVAEKVINSA